MSLFPEEATTAKLAADKFMQLMKERPQYWGENICDSIEKLTDEKEQMMFMKWLADPYNKTGNKDKPVQISTNYSTDTFENHPDYEVLSTVSGSVPLVRLLYKPQKQDEKNPEWISLIKRINMPSKWIQHVQAYYRARKKKDSSYKYSSAMSDSRASYKSAKSAGAGAKKKVQRKKGRGRNKLKVAQ